MVLELKVPHSATFDALLSVTPVLGSYVLSFIYVGIYWNEHQYACYPPLANHRKTHGCHGSTLFSPWASTTKKSSDIVM